MSATTSAITALVTAYQARIDLHQQRILTRQNAPGSAGTADDTKLQAIAGDAIEEFEIRTGIAFDHTQRYHLSTGVPLMTWFLLNNARSFEGAKQVWADQCKDRLDNIRKMRARPLSVDSATDQQDPTVPTRQVKPDFDEFGDMWDDIGAKRNINTVAWDEIHPF